MQLIKHIYWTKFIFGDSLEHVDDKYMQDNAGDLHADDVSVLSLDFKESREKSALVERLKIAEGIIRKLYARSMELTDENRRLCSENSNMKDKLASYRAYFPAVHVEVEDGIGKAGRALTRNKDIATSQQVGHDNDPLKAEYYSHARPSSLGDARFGCPGPELNEGDRATSVPLVHNPHFLDISQQHGSKNAPSMNAASEHPVPQPGDDLPSDKSSWVGLNSCELAQELGECRRREALLRAQLQAHMQQARELDMQVKDGQPFALLEGRNREKLVVARKMLRDLTNSSYVLQEENATLRQQLADRDELAQSRSALDHSLHHATAI
jgi:hypothetical protein